MTDIIVCDKKQFDEGKASGVDIKVCTDDRGDDIVACPDEECSGVQDPMTINLSAGNSVDTGDFASVTCGTAPYLYEISCGEIDPVTGEIGDVSLSGEGCCGTGEITVTDFCGAKARKDVAYPDGQWVQIPSSVITNGPLLWVDDDDPENPYQAPAGGDFNCGNKVGPWIDDGLIQEFEDIGCHWEPPEGTSMVNFVQSKNDGCWTNSPCSEGTVTHQRSYFLRGWQC